FSAHANIARQLTHVARAGDGAQSDGKHARVVVLQAFIKIKRDVFFVVQVTGRVPRPGCYGVHNLLQVDVQVGRDLLCADDIATLGVLAATAQHDHFAGLGLNVIQPITGAVGQAQFAYARADRLPIAEVAATDTIRGSGDLDPRPAVTQFVQPAVEDECCANLDHEAKCSL